MENENYLKMLQDLSNDRDQMLMKVKAIEMAIEALSHLTSDISSSFMHKSIENNKTEIEKKIEKRNIYEDYEVVIPFTYDSELPLIEKLLFALQQKNGAFAHDAAKYIYDIDQSITLEYLKSRFTDLASSLGRAKKLNTKKIGKKFKYTIPVVVNNYSEDELKNEIEKKNIQMLEELDLL